MARTHGTDTKIDASVGGVRVSISQDRLNRLVDELSESAVLPPTESVTIGPAAFHTRHVMPMEYTMGSVLPVKVGQVIEFIFLDEAVLLVVLSVQGDTVKLRRLNDVSAGDFGEQLVRITIPMQHST